MSGVRRLGRTYDEWTAEADKRVKQRVGFGLGLSDLPDGPSWDAWNQEQDPAEYADQLLEDEGFPSEDETLDGCDC